MRAVSRESRLANEVCRDRAVDNAKHPAHTYHLLRKRRVVILDNLVEHHLLGAVALVAARRPVQLRRRCRSDLASPLPPSMRTATRFLDSPGRLTVRLNVSFPGQVGCEFQIVTDGFGSKAEKRAHRLHRTAVLLLTWKMVAKIKLCATY